VALGDAAAAVNHARSAGAVLAAGLGVLRNLSAHGRAGEVSGERAMDYLALADAVLYALRNPTRG